MQRVSGANYLADGAGAGKNTYQDYNPATGQAGTTPNADALTALQEEIGSLIEWQGIALNGADNTQLRQAIIAYVAAQIGTFETVSAAATALAAAVAGLDNPSEVAAAIAAALANYASLAGATFTGPVSGPTPAAGNSSPLLATTAFVNPGASLAAQGYEKRPSGKIRIWTTFSFSISPHGQITITWPVAMPTAVTDFGAVANGLNSASGGISANFASAPTLTGATLILDCFASGASASGTGIAWIEGY